MRHDRWMFALGALYTCAIALAVMIAPDWVSNAFYHHPLKDEPAAVRFVVGDFGGSLLLWGIAYGSATTLALDPGVNRGTGHVDVCR